MTADAAQRRTALSKAYLDLMSAVNTVAVPQLLNDYSYVEIASVAEEHLEVKKAEGLDAVCDVAVTLLLAADRSRYSFIANHAAEWVLAATNQARELQDRGQIDHLDICDLNRLALALSEFEFPGDSREKLITASARLGKVAEDFIEGKLFSDPRETTDARDVAERARQAQRRFEGNGLRKAFVRFALPLVAATLAAAATYIVDHRNDADNCPATIIDVQPR